MPKAVKNSEWSLVHAQRALALGRAREAEGLCNRRVAEDPTDVAAWHVLGNALAEDGKLDRAIGAFRRALRIDDTLGEVHNDLGTAYYEKQRYDRAEQSFKRAIQLRPDHGVAYANLGAALRAQGKLVEGRRAFQRALLLKLRAALPRFLRWKVGAEAAHARSEEIRKLRSALGEALEQRQAARIRELAERAVAAYPEDAEALYLAAEAIGRLADTPAALVHARKAVQLEPERAAYLVTLATLLLRNHEHAAALKAAESAVRLEPDSVEAHAILATALRLAGRLDHAEQAALRAIELDPERADGYDDMAMVLRARNRLEDAESQEREAVRRAPREARYRVNLALILKDQGKMDEARRAYRALAAELARAAGVPGFICQSVGTLALECDADLDRARDWFRRAAQHGEPDTALLSEGVTDLLEWRFDIAWEKAEARKRVLGQRERHDLFAGFPAWDGNAAAEHGLLVYGEQGVGDEILFASMIPDLQGRVPNIKLMCDPRLQQLFARSFPGVDVMRGTYETVDALKGKVSCAVASGSLGLAFRRSAADFPARTSYLRADSADVDRWRAHLGELGSGRKIGLSWRGGILRTGRNRRSLSLTQLHSVLSVPGIDWISLQHGDCADEITHFAEHSGIQVHHYAGITDDIDDLAALIEALDLVVSVSNTTVHVAGALGKPVLVLAAFVPLWLYGLRGERMAWYPSARVFRQRGDFSWDDALSQVQRAVAAIASTES